MSKIAIIGYGHVGKAMHRLFPDAQIYDKYNPQYDDRSAVCGMDLAIVCVPTDEMQSSEADISIVTEVVGWLDAELICIKSTVPPGTTNALRWSTGKRIVFSPEYEGETPWQKGLTDPLSWPFIFAGGMRADANAVLEFFQARLGPNLTYLIADATTVEVAKYMENTWLALQVTFAGEFYEIALAVGADYGTARELWALDPRMSKWNTLVFPHNRGFSGKCLPKDLSAIIAAARRGGYRPRLLEEVRKTNERHRMRSARRCSE
ncbi:hypothetical protein LCGC14_1829110 [marine sediment metagenome]|uniref:UDP-glucose/GDP-mannose dehydrogenase dimerisation domain-containing protein n=1 Tax=marine sediment metagenome TaxID=412755 RepID=A0A0F9GGV1_9ZZZZ